MPPPSKRILVIDDDAQIRRLLRTLLEHDGFVVEDACDGREGLAKLRGAPMDLALIDLIMPEKEGLETIDEIRQLNPDLAIIAISGGGKFAPDTYLKAAKTLGAAATLAKPIDIRRLRIIVKRLTMARQV